MKNIIKYLLSLFLIANLQAQENYDLKSYVNKVLESDYGVKIISNETIIAANENNIGNAGYLPSISTDLRRDITVNTARQEFLGNQVNEAENARNTAFDMGAMLEWTIFDGFKMFATDKKLDYLEDYAKLNLQAEMEMKAYQAAVAFYTHILLTEMRSIFQDAIELSNARYDYLQRRNNAGAGTKTALLQAKLDLTADSAAYLNNEREIDIIQNELNLLIATENPVEIITEGELPEATKAFSMEQLLEKAKNQNANLLLAKSNIAIRAQEEKEAKSRFYPQLGVYANYNFNTSQNEVGFLRSNRVYGPSVGITLRWDILDQLSRFQELKNAKINQQNAELMEQQETLIIRSELQEAYANYEWAKKNMQFESRNQMTATEITEITKQAFEAGSITALELREIQFGIIDAKSRFLAAQMEYITAELNIGLTTGDFQNW